MKQVCDGDSGEDIERIYRQAYGMFASILFSVNKRDVVNLSSVFGSLSEIMQATKEELLMCPGIGALKASEYTTRFIFRLLRRRSELSAVVLLLKIVSRANKLTHAHIIKHASHRINTTNHRFYRNSQEKTNLCHVYSMCIPLIMMRTRDFCVRTRSTGLTRIKIAFGSYVLRYDKTFIIMILLIIRTSKTLRPSTKHTSMPLIQSVGVRKQVLCFYPLHRDHSPLLPLQTVHMQRKIVQCTSSRRRNLRLVKWSEVTNPTLPSTHVRERDVNPRPPRPYHQKQVSCPDAISASSSRRSNRKTPIIILILTKKNTTHIRWLLIVRG